MNGGYRVLVTWLEVRPAGPGHHRRRSPAAPPPRRGRAIQGRRQRQEAPPLPGPTMSPGAPRTKNQAPENEQAEEERAAHQAAEARAAPAASAHGSGRPLAEPRGQDVGDPVRAGPTVARSARPGSGPRLPFAEALGRCLPNGIEALAWLFSREGAGDDCSGPPPLFFCTVGSVGVASAVAKRARCWWGRIE